MRINNIDIDNAAAFADEVKKDKIKALKTKRVEGNWNLENGKVQFSAVLEHPKGSTVIESDGPSFMGGSGIKPDPVQYCLFGLAACYAQTFASIAAEKGMGLSKLKVVAENKVNLLMPLGLGNEPVVEGVKISVEVSAQNNTNLDEIKNLAGQRCPGVYCLTTPIKLDIELKQ